MDSSMQKQSNPNSSMQRRQDILAEALPCKNTKIAKQRLRRCSQSENSGSFHAAEEMQPSNIKHARQRHGDAANHAAT